MLDLCKRKLSAFENHSSCGFRDQLNIRSKREEKLYHVNVFFFIFLRLYTKSSYLRLYFSLSMEYSAAKSILEA